MTATFDSLGASPPPPSAEMFGHRLIPPGDPLEGATFDAIFEQKIKPELIKREADRKSAVQTFLVAALAGLALIALETYLIAPLAGGAFGRVPVTIETITFIGAAIIGYMPLAAVAQRVRVSVLTALCEPLGVTYSLVGNEPAELPRYRAFNLLPAYSEKSFQDFFSGRRGPADFSLCEATFHEGSGKQRHVVFSGQMLRLTTPRHVASQTVVLRNTGWLKSFECPNGLKAVGLEDPKFNQAFAVFGSDQVEAREILTPAFMQQLVDLETAYSGAHIRCAFDGSQLLIALQGPNRFEIGGMFTTLVQRSRVEGVARNLEQVFKLIDQFKDA